MSENDKTTYLPSEMAEEIVGVKELYYKKLCEFKTNRNLLDNWYFAYGKAITESTPYSNLGTFPINQRGDGSYSNDGTYAIDRWKIAGSGAVTVGAGFLRFYGVAGANAWLQTWSDNLAIYGKQITISMLLKNGALLTATGSLSAAPVASDTGFSTSSIDGIAFGVLKTPSGNWVAQIGNVQNGNSVVNADVVAVKVELGSAQTLAHNEGTDANPVWVLNEIPVYSEELAKCQRYQWVVGPGPCALGFGQAMDANNVMAIMNAPVTFCKSPGVSLLRGSAFFRNGTVTIESSAITEQPTAYDMNPVHVAFGTTGGLTPGAPYEVYLTSGSKIIFDANL